MSIKILELEEHCTSLTQKVSGLEKQKSRLSQEIEILILDLEKVSQGEDSDARTGDARTGDGGQVRRTGHRKTDKGASES